jgi:hypothetical protein
VQKKDRARGISRLSTGHGIRLGPIWSDDAAADEHGCAIGRRSEHGAARSGYTVSGYHPGKGDRVRSGDSEPGSWAVLGHVRAGGGRRGRDRKENRVGPRRLLVCCGKRKGERDGLAEEKRLKRVLKFLFYFLG